MRFSDLSVTLRPKVTIERESMEAGELLIRLREEDDFSEALAGCFVWKAAFGIESPDIAGGACEGFVFAGIRSLPKPEIRAWVSENVSEEVGVKFLPLSV